MTPRRRCQPGSGATRAEPVFPTKREGPARRRRRHAVAAEALVPPDAGSSRRDLYRDSRRNSVHKCPNPARRGPILPFVYTIAIPRSPTTQAHGPTVYTNAPKRHREAISTDLCTLLRRRPGGEAHVAGVVTQPPTHTSSRSRQKVSSNLSCAATIYAHCDRSRPTTTKAITSNVKTRNETVE